MSKPKKSRPLKRRPVKPVTPDNDLNDLLAELNTWYGCMFESGDFDKLHALFIKCYKAGQNKKVI